MVRLVLAALLTVCTVGVKAQEGALDVRPGSLCGDSPDMGYVYSVYFRYRLPLLPSRNAGANVPDFVSRQFGEVASLSGDVASLDVGSLVPLSRLRNEAGPASPSPVRIGVSVDSGVLMSLGAVGFLLVPMTPALDFVTHIFLMRPSPQVRDVHAERGIAGVKYLESVFNGAMHSGVCVTMSPPFNVVKAEGPVAIRANRASPNMATAFGGNSEVL